MSLARADEVGGLAGREAPVRSTNVPLLRLFSLRRLSRSTSVLLGVLSPLALLVIWEVFSRTGVLDQRFFPPPTQVFRTFYTSVTSGQLMPNVLVSCRRIGIGFLLGAVPGLVIGLGVGLSPLTRGIVQPLVNATFPIPKLAVLPLVIMLFGLGETSKYVVIAITVVYLVLLNTAVGVRQIEPTLFEAAATFKASRWMVFWHVALPGAMPMILAGCKLGMNVALLVIVAVEFTGATSGIGYLIWNSWQIFQVDVMYVGLVSTAMLGFLIAAIFAGLERLLVPWRAH